MADNQFRDSSDILDRPAELRQRAAEDGYLYVRGLIPRETILELRSQFLDICRSYGWLDTNSDINSGRTDSAAIGEITPEALAFCGVGVPREAYEDVQRLESFHALAHHSNLLKLYSALFEGPVLPHPRNIARVMLPAASAAPTPPHQDFIHIQGTVDVWTCWIPAGDCPSELGGLSVLRSSQKEGLLPVQEAEGAGGAEVLLCEKETDWVSGAMEAGDILTFSSHTVHKALPNLVGDTVRLSCDYRYQPADKDIEEKSLVPHCGILEWDEIYRDWGNTELQYYWQKTDLSMSQWDESLRWQKARICD